MKLSSYKTYILALLSCFLLLAEAAYTQDCGNSQNVARNKTATQSSLKGNGTADLAVDGNLIGDENWGSNPNLQHTDKKGAGKQWWQVDLGEVHQIDEIKIYNRVGSESVTKRLQDFVIFISETPISPDRSLADLEADNSIYQINYGTGIKAIYSFTPDQAGRYVRVQLRNNQSLHMSEVEVYGCTGGDDPSDPDPDPLGTPQGLQASNIGQTTATLSWNAVSGADKYFIYQGNSNNVYQEVTGTSTQLTNLTANTNYSFRIAAEEAVRHQVNLQLPVSRPWKRIALRHPLQETVQVK